MVVPLAATWLSFLLAAARPGEHLKPLDIYGSTTEFFRRHRVREIVVLEQGYYKGQLSGTRRALLVQQLDRQGCMVKEWKFPSEHRFSALEQSTYNATGHLTDLVTYRNESPATDTSRLGTHWQPETHFHDALAPGQAGYQDQWNPQLKKWQRTEAIRRWSSHDTTYVRRTRLPGGTCSTLLRSYATADGRTRHDYLMLGYCFLNNMALFSPQYSYEQQANGQLVEGGLLTFDKALQEYLRQHPTLPVPAEGTHAYNNLLDYVAHHSAGQAYATTRSYDARGRLLVEAGKINRQTYEYNPQGQVQARVWYSYPAPDVKPVLIDRTTFTYQPDGLVAREHVSEGTLGLAAIRYYQYRYY
jgi:hypothetical protein